MKAATAKTRTRFENILFATDFSPAAAHTIAFVKKIAGHFESGIVVACSSSAGEPDDPAGQLAGRHRCGESLR
jgi:hypothetical protein